MRMQIVRGKEFSRYEKGEAKRRRADGNYVRLLKISSRSVRSSSLVVLLICRPVSGKLGSDRASLRSSETLNA